MKRIPLKVKPKVPVARGYKCLIQRELKRVKVTVERDRFIQFFQQYWFQQQFLIPPWAESALAFHRQHHPELIQLGQQLGGQEIPVAESRLGWLPVPKTKQWVRVIQGQCIPLRLYFTCNLWKRGTPSEQAELALLRRQVPAGMLFYPGEFDFGNADAETRAQFCRAMVRDHADVLIFSEFEAEYGRFVGFGVFGDIQEAQRKGIPILLLRKRQFWLNPRVQVHDPENLICHAKVRATPHPPLQCLEEWFYLGD